jgi:hypothetical protein
MFGLTDQDNETILCALRAWQKMVEEGTAVPHMDLDHPMMTSDEIDELCETINFGGKEE